MKLSVIVVVYNMPREAPRTLLSLTPGYQQHISADDYEVIVVENGSTKRLEPSQVTQLGSNFQYYYLENASPSPAKAINFGMQRARGAVIGVMIDGARICTPGLLRQALIGISRYDRAIVASSGFYLGNEYQRSSVLRGYNEHEEDRLLENIGWPRDGYRLFEVGARDESTHWVKPSAESNALFMRKELWIELRGFDERFDYPGGGLLNLDTFVRACELPNTELVVILGEGHFHQIHNGVATNTPLDVHEKNITQWKKQYLELRGKEYAPLEKSRRFTGPFAEPSLSHVIEEISELRIWDLCIIGSQLDAHEAEITQLKADVHRLQSERDHVQSDRACLQTQLNTLLSSRSWRITKPLRAAFRVLSALRNRILGSTCRP